MNSEIEREIIEHQAHKGILWVLFFLTLALGVVAYVVYQLVQFVVIFF